MLLPKFPSVLPVTRAVEEFTDVLFVIFWLCVSWEDSRMSNIAIKRVQREFKEIIGASANGEVGDFSSFFDKICHNLNLFSHNYFKLNLAH